MGTGGGIGMAATEGVIDPHLIDQLPSLPGVAMEFIRMCDDESVGAADVAQIAQRDPALLSRILQVANSPYYGVREPTTNIVRASAILGLRNLKLLAVGVAVMGELWEAGAPSDALAGVVGAGAIAGAGARTFSAQIGTGREDEAFVAGLLSFVGELAMLHAAPDAFAELWAEADGLPGTTALRARLGVSGPDLGLFLLEKWQIPDDLRQGVASRRDPIDDRTHPSIGRFQASLGFGTSVAELISTGGNAEKVLAPCRRWGIDESAFWSLWGDFRLAVRRANADLGLRTAAALDQLVVDMKDDYMRSDLRAGMQLRAAEAELERLRAEAARLEDLSLTDPLTGVANRARYDLRMKEAFARLERSGTGVGLVLFDLDRFKQVNDRFGHSSGDSVLTVIAIAGDRAAREHELFARIGGDEFALVVEADAPEDVGRAAARVRAEMVASLADTPGEGLVGVSLGSAFARTVERTPADLFQLADDQLYEAKRITRDDRAA